MTVKASNDLKWQLIVHIYSVHVDNTSIKWIMYIYIYILNWMIICSLLWYHNMHSFQLYTHPKLKIITTHYRL